MLIIYQKLTHRSLIEGTLSGDNDIVGFNIIGFEFRAISAGPYFKINPLIIKVLNYSNFLTGCDILRLSYEFYQKDAVQAAKDLLGKIIVRKYDGKTIKSKIIETEAYMGSKDKASHAYNNKKTKRTKTMFAKGGQAYIYLIYGMYHCFNIVTAEKDNPHAVLIRAVEPVEGLEEIKKNRKIKSKKVENLTNGPGKLSQALNIDKSLDACDLVKSKNLYLVDIKNENFKIETAPRVNIDYAEEYKDKKWRFYIKNNKFISKS